MRDLCRSVAVAQIEAVCIETRAARRDSDGWNAVLPRPVFGVLTEAQADLLITIAVFHDEAADEGVGWRLEPMLIGDFDPADDLPTKTSDECGLGL